MCSIQCRFCAGGGKYLQTTCGPRSVAGGRACWEHVAPQLCVVGIQRWLVRLHASDGLFSAKGARERQEDLVCETWVVLM